MEPRKQKEIEYYNQRAEQWLKKPVEERSGGDFEGFKPERLASFLFCYQWLKEYCPNKIILDYGCGNGIHATFLAKYGAKVIGIENRGASGVSLAAMAITTIGLLLFFNYGRKKK